MRSSFHELDGILDIIDMFVYRHERVVAGLEFSHIKFPLSEENVEWCISNAELAEELVKRCIKKHGKRIGFVASILVNNLSTTDEVALDAIIDKILKGKKFLARDRVKIIAERNMKNRAFLTMKKNYRDIERLDSELSGRYGCRLFIGKSPRCGLIISSFVERLRDIAWKRAKRPFLFISFSEKEYEYRRVLLGIESYRRLHEDVGYFACHWSPEHGVVHFSTNITINSAMEK